MRSNAAMALLDLEEVEEVIPEHRDSSFLHRYLDDTCDKLRTASEWLESNDQDWRSFIETARHLPIPLDKGRESRPWQEARVYNHESSLSQELSALAEEWKRSRPKMPGSVLKAVMHPAYQRIIGKGEPAIPFILRELQRKPDHWFWALMAITGQDPVTPDISGNLRQMAAAWITWGRENGYL